MGKLIEAVRKLGNKLTGKQTVESNSLVKVINDIADDYEGGGGGTAYTAGDNITIENNVISATDTKYTAGNKGIYIDEDNIMYNTFGSASIILSYLNITTSGSISKGYLKEFVDLKVLDFDAPSVGLGELPSAESTESYVYLHPYSSITNESEDEYTLTWVSEVYDGKYYKMTVVLSDPVPNKVPCTIEIVNVSSGGGTDYGLEFQPTSKVLKPFVEYWLNLQGLGTENVDTVKIDTAKLKQILTNIGYDLDVAITIPQTVSTEELFNITFEINSTDSTGYGSYAVKHWGLTMRFVIVSPEGSTLKVMINDYQSSLSDEFREDITGFSGNTLEDLLDYMITNNINLKLAYNDDFYGVVGWEQMFINGFAEGSHNWYDAALFSNISITYFDYDVSSYVPTDIYYIDIDDFEDALIYEYHGE